MSEYQLREWALCVNPGPGTAPEVAEAVLRLLQKCEDQRRILGEMAVRIAALSTKGEACLSSRLVQTT